MTADASHPVAEPGGDAGADSRHDSRNDSQLDSRWVDQAFLSRSSAMARWMGWRLRVLVVLALLGSVGVFALLRVLAVLPHIDAQWRSIGPNGIELVGSSDPALRQKVGRRLVALERSDGRRIEVDASLLQRSPRWTVGDVERGRQIALQDHVGQALREPVLRFVFDDRSIVELKPAPRGFPGLGALFWLLCALALVLYLIAAVVALAAPGVANLLYALVAVSQSANLVLIAVESMPAFGVAPGFGQLALDLRTLCDLVAAAAILHACLVHPARLPRAGWLAIAAWSGALLFALLAMRQALPAQWWLTQAMLIGYGLAAVAVLTWSYRLEPHPFSIVVRRLGLAASGILILLTIAVALVSTESQGQHTVATFGSMAWYVFIASLLLLVPFMSRSQHVMREFAMLAGISTVATSLDLLFVAVFALGQFASVTLSLFVALGLYVGARQWLVNQFMGTGVLTAERMFESLYRVAREIEATPRKSEDQLARLLRELFEPLEVARVPRPVSRTRVASDGSTMVVPVPRLPGAAEDDEQPASGAIVLRYARRGRRLFSSEDARLTDRVLEQLRRAVAFDRAVEQGRSEERARIAQDLHDDIGARLLTLMYKAQNPEMEEYIRHTLQDLKTLTRGLAASSHKLSHAAAEWKSDITQRLNVTHCDLVWSFSADRDIPLTVVQWSGLTRVLRELVNNIIAHAQASCVEISGQYDRGRLVLTVSDDGIGRQPERWSHGLGLGGVRKRVKLLGGEVRWRERSSRGIVCEVRVPLLGTRV
ncbi:histidine kinase [Aquincola sp. S2]|uniref:histidine kinase n=1 Tax=Pseudaquabacterium terrae TaxID=2732868 RepID=A0ABX2EMW5_9BURK|nr:ATP-binding protein [Aquabacterium terrae]NRF69965.1 histidine kinase [Aquabacterium terrae]